jgi:hypothetical protein
MAIRYGCSDRRLFRVMQRLPRHYYTAEAIRFGTLDPDNLEAQSFTPKDGAEVSVMHVIPVADGDPLPCVDDQLVTA